MRRLWHFIRKPSATYSLGILVFIGGIGGVIFWGGFNTAMEATNSMAFCISCHEMRDNVYVEYKETVHYKNASGVRALCSDCHVPHEWTPKVIRKIKASKELWGKMTGVISTPEKFEEHRATMAMREWTRMEKNNSQECRNCHSYDAMDFHAQSPDAAKEMQVAMEQGDTCISCHKGIAHKMPDLSAGFKKSFEDMQLLGGKKKSGADKLYTITSKSAYLSQDEVSDGGRGAGSLLAATGLLVLEQKGDALKVRLEGWQQDGADRVIYARMGHRIFDAALAPAAVEQIVRHDSIVDQNTDQTWHKASIDLWVSAEDMIEDPDMLWSYGKEMHQASCSSCHSLHAADSHLANQWIGVVKSMERFITLDKEETRMLQKYLQLHASDIEESAI